MVGILKDAIIKKQIDEKVGAYGKQLRCKCKELINYSFFMSRFKKPISIRA